MHVLADYTSTHIQRESFLCCYMWKGIIHDLWSVQCFKGIYYLCIIAHQHKNVELSVECGNMYVLTVAERRVVARTWCMSWVWFYISVVCDKYCKCKRCEQWKEVGSVQSDTNIASSYFLVCITNDLFIYPFKVK